MATQKLTAPLMAATKRTTHAQRTRPLPTSSVLRLAQTHPFTTTIPKRTLAPPLNIPKWLETNAHLLRPPINNHCIHHTPLTVMIVGGPNARTDYHINSTPEFFYQHRGRMLLKTRDPATRAPNDIYIDEGSLFLLPANIPHNPVRFADTVGVVVEQPRAEGDEDLLRWYCGGCGGVVAERGFVAVDLGSQIKAAVQALDGDVGARTCGECGTVCEVRPGEEEMERMRTG